MSAGIIALIGSVLGLVGLILKYFFSRQPTQAELYRREVDAYKKLEEERFAQAREAQRAVEERDVDAIRKNIEDNLARLAAEKRVRDDQKK